MEDRMSLQEEIDKLKEQWDHYLQRVEKPCRCIFCEGTRLYWNGYRERSASVLIGDEVVYFADILCKRVKCAEPECNRSWTLRPPGLMPRRHYQLCVVGHGVIQFFSDPRETLTSVAEAHCCSRRTIGRWLHWIAGIADPSDLLRRLSHISKKAALSNFVKVYKIFKKVPNKIIFQGTVKNFCFLEALGRAYGYAPSGFRGMIETAIANRDRITTYRCPFIPELAR
jgi:hypothetical protein